MSNMSGAVPYEFDAELVLRAEDATDLAADADLPVQELVQTGAKWQGHRDIKNGTYVVVVNVTKLAGDNTLALVVKTASDAAKSNPQTQYTFAVPGVGRYILPIEEAGMAAADADATHWFISADVGGTSPAVNFEAYIAPRARGL